METAVGLATITFNDGLKSFVKVLENLNISCGALAKQFFDTEDKNRIKQAEIRAMETSLEYRREKRQEKRTADERQEDGAYACGAHVYK